jgi:hypothetical protein
MLRVLEAETETSGRAIIRAKAQTLVSRCRMPSRRILERLSWSRRSAWSEAESKDHMNWELMGEAAPKLEGERKQVRTEAFQEVGEQENEHLYHTMGWARELWLGFLRLPAVLPPPEEERRTKTAIEARACQARPRGEAVTTDVTHSEIGAIAVEVRTDRDTADHMAGGQQPDEADGVRVLAGKIRQLAEQVERLMDHVGRGE